ncbi:MAG TPA: hypothetical protein VF588_02360 [Pyrinomonadaceae bacterium]|jgi:hypothetical protein
MKRTALSKILFLTLIFFIPGGGTSLACMYGPPYKTVCESYAQADAVIVGKIESVDGDHLNQSVVIKVERTFKGRKRKEFVLSQPQSTCDWDFSGEVGKTMLLYLVRHRETNKYSALAQGMGGRVEKEQENLYWLNKLPKALNRTRLSGAVRLYKNDPFEFVNFPVGVKVRVFNRENSFEVLTDKSGVYEIWDIPVGKYRIEPLLPSNLKLSFALEKGLVDFDSLKKDDPNTNAVLIEIEPKGCGGIDFVVNGTVN